MHDTYRLLIYIHFPFKLCKHGRNWLSIVARWRESASLFVRDMTSSKIHVVCFGRLKSIVIEISVSTFRTIRTDYHSKFIYLFISAQNIAIGYILTPDE